MLDVIRDGVVSVGCGTEKEEESCRCKRDWEMWERCYEM